MFLVYNVHFLVVFGYIIDDIAGTVHQSVEVTSPSSSRTGISYIRIVGERVEEGAIFPHQDICKNPLRVTLLVIFDMTHSTSD